MLYIFGDQGQQNDAEGPKGLNYASGHSPRNDKKQRNKNKSNHIGMDGMDLNSIPKCKMRHSPRVDTRYGIISQSL